MRSARRYLVLVFALSLFESGLAVEPELISELAVESKVVGGDMTGGRLVFSSAERLWISTPEGRESFQANLQADQSVVASQDGDFFGITTYSKDVPAGFLAARKFELYSADGRKLWEIDDPGVSEFCISNGAELIAGISTGDESPESRLVFFDRAGKLILSTTVGFLIGVSFSANGKHFLVNSARDGLMSFGESGQLERSLGPCDKFAVSWDGEWVATVSDGHLRLFHQGKPTGDSAKMNPLVRAMSFSPENEYLAVVDKKNLYLFEVAKGELLWQYTLNQAEQSFISVDVSSGGEGVIAGVDIDKGREARRQQRHTKGLVYILDRKGKITWQREFSYELWSTLFPRVRFSADGTRFSVMTREKVYLFEEGRAEK
jgi:outer membrane protein assembly factor BamB